ncbi:helix-turn-helix domain-containing protein [Bowmanella yangjiangensis]|nr:helix-turn-helix domain-containing protein [Bowmanella yangjiangensis]
MTFGERIKQLRNETGLSRLQLISEADTEPSYLSGVWG